MNQTNGTQGGDQFTNNGGSSFFTSGGDVKENKETKNNFPLEKIKNSITKNVVLSLLIIIIIVAIGFVFFKSSSKNNEDVSVHTSYPNMISAEGMVKDIFEGTNDLNYSFSIPETATTTNIGDDDSLIRVTDGDTKQASVYFSYEGSKNLTPSDYISYIVAPHVPVIDIKENQSIGNYNWQLASTAGSNWYVTSLNDGAWIVAIEAKKGWSDQANLLVQSFSLK